ncbi:MAG: thiamine diphosphokinase [Bacteroidales bacterium]|jgi:thiamine pyrophosphokinase|nr:thiamine diphosphokinase [Bacteroidales bacterium]
MVEKSTVIVADGEFPRHRVPLQYLATATSIICCDGAARALVEAGFIPDAIVGDMDSIDSALSERFSDRLFRDPDQETNDLTKAVKWAVAKGLTNLVILGATGKREDHTIANISLLAEYVLLADLVMVTDNGIFTPLPGPASLASFPGQQVSVFSIVPGTEITSSGLRYPLVNRKLLNWWCGSLNEATGNEITLTFRSGRVIVFQKHA